jgi:hypothetical protein
MKKQSKNTKPKTPALKNKSKMIKELAQHFEETLNAKLPIAIQPDGSIVYKTFVIRQQATGNWGLYNINSRDLIEQFFLKTSALLAARAYSKTFLEKFFEIKELDNQYWANYSDTLIYAHNIQKAKDFERFQILLTRLEHSRLLTEQFKDRISKMFKWSFV